MVNFPGKKCTFSFEKMAEMVSFLGIGGEMVVISPWENCVFLGGFEQLWEKHAECLWKRFEERLIFGGFTLVSPGK